MPVDRSTQPQNTGKGGVIVQIHPVYDEIRMRIRVKEETDCRRCIHHKVCRIDMEKRCANYEMGTSEYPGCAGCIHRFTRWDRDGIPCFYCEDFKEETA